MLDVALTGFNIQIVGIGTICTRGLVLICILLSFFGVLGIGGCT